MLVSSHVYETLQMLSKPKRYLQNLQWNMHFELAENMHSYPCVDIWSCSRRDVITLVKYSHMCDLQHLGTDLFGAIYVGFSI